MTKFLVAVVIALGAVTANAGATCNPEQQACTTPGTPQGAPAWLTAVGAYMASLPGYQGLKVACNPEQSACVVFKSYNGGPAWLQAVGNAIASLPGYRGTQPAFDDGKGQ